MDASDSPDNQAQVPGKQIMDFHVAKAIVNVTFITAKPTHVEHLAAVRRAEAFFLLLMVMIFICG